jgi:hypothetical protein
MPTSYGYAGWRDYTPGFLETAVDYYTKPSAAAVAATATAAKTDPSKRPKTGSYTEGGYTYWYNAVAHSITIVSSPRAAKTNTPVPPGTAFDAILKKIISGAAKPVSVPAPSAAAPAAPSYRPKTSGGAAAASVAPPVSAAEAAPEPFYRRTWFAPAAALSAVALAALLLLPKRAT